jgi:NADH dehydrogenase (ubiquinone) Fe-S protein 3
VRCKTYLECCLQDIWDLRRIITDYGFDRHALRKDFLTTAYTEIRYNEEKMWMVYRPLNMTQAYRNFRGRSAA